MNKTLMATASMLVFSSPAYAGPILEGLMEDNMSWVAADSTVVNGMETYTDLTINRINRSIKIQKLQMMSVDGLLRASFHGMDVFPGSPEAVMIKEGSFAVAEVVFDTGLTGIEKI